MITLRGYFNRHVDIHQSKITHTPSLSFPLCLRISIFCKAERSRSMVRWLTDKVTDIFLAVIVGDSLMRLRIFCWRSVSFVSDISPTSDMSVEAKMVVWNWVGVDLNTGLNSSLYPSKALVVKFDHFWGIITWPCLSDIDFQHMKKRLFIIHLIIMAYPFMCCNFVSNHYKNIYQRW